MAAEVAKAFQAFSFLIGEITSLESIGGFLTTRILSFVPLLLCLWVAIVAVGLTRGEEQNGALDMLLSTPHSRRSVRTEKVLALAVLAVAVVGLVGVGVLLGVIAAGEQRPVRDVALAVLEL